MPDAPLDRPGRRAKGGVRRTVTLVCTVLVAPLAGSGCATGADAAGGGGPVRVVAAENVWGSLARQLGGAQARVTEIINSPAADPHDYEPTVADARAIAQARLVIVNGVGYDSWAEKIVRANPDPRRIVLTVGTLAGVPVGGNPHQWYSPATVRRVVDEISAAYRRADPAHAAFFEQQRARVLTSALGPYFRLVEDIRARYAGTPVGASESVLSPLAEATGLRLLTPATFLTAISEGSDPTAADKAAVDAQIREKLIKVYVYNSQNTTPDVQRQVTAARTAGIPVTAVTETLTPPGGSFQDWQVTQLTDLREALADGTGR